MFDAFPETPAQADAWKSQLSHGDLVLFKFPVLENDGSATPKGRPCLVLDVEFVAGTKLALIAYGTTSTRKQNRGYSILVSAAECRAAGLAQATKFTGARTVLVSLDNPAFGISPTTGSPIIGHLDGAARERMNAVRGRLHAERDMAAERRRERRRLRARQPRVRGRDFTVEVRHPRRKPRVEAAR